MTLDNLLENDSLFLFIRVLLITGCTLGMMSALTRFKYRLKKVLAIFGLYLLWVLFSTWIVLSLFGFLGLVRVFLFTISAPAIFLAYRMDREAPALSVFNYTTQIAFSLVLTVVVLLLNTAVHGNKYTDLLIRASSYALVIFLEYRFLRAPFHRLTNVIRAGWGILSLIPVFFCLLLVLVASVPVFYTEAPVRILYILGIVIVMLVVYFTVYYSLIRQYRLLLLIHDRDMLKVQICAMNKQAETVRAAEERLRILRHDIRHYTAVIQSHLLNGSPAQAAAILSSLQDAAGKNRVKAYCNDYVINSVLAAYLDKAAEEGIAVKTAFSAPPEGKTDVAAFSVVLSHALENALEACEEESGERFIELKSRLFNGQYLMELSNTCRKAVRFDRQGLPLSQKGEGRGLGTRSIFSFARENDAVVYFSLEEGRFVMQMMMEG